MISCSMITISGPQKYPWLSYNWKITTLWCFKILYTGLQRLYVNKLYQYIFIWFGHRQIYVKKENLNKSTGFCFDLKVTFVFPIWLTSVRKYKTFEQ